MTTAPDRFPSRLLEPAVLARVHGAFNMAGGLWPLLHLRSFEAVFGPKADRWLEHTVGGLLTGLGWAQWQAGTPADWKHARRIGVATAGTLLAIDLVYVPQGRIRWTYLFDAAEEIALLAAWAAASTRHAAS
ncbi:hypothetical protein [Nocardioides jiangxiensis]|uniref:Uncharacterized protein n=1 Tax=Nocardioides jiangxiensis TaxID=3064524 RepID=A0ABT9AX85_9ACTN|nr:hypothetical protein [Nocardioides sp. WY-20]MDO7867139.1 hypothetical protein [Nocardioides sp. WY-20]